MDAGIDQIANGSYHTKSRADIRGSGYVVDALEAALWAISNADTFGDAVLLAANLGDDADTTAAIAGQLAGALWGKNAIPQAWTEKLAWREQIEKTADMLYRKSLLEPAEK